MPVHVSKRRGTQPVDRRKLIRRAVRLLAELGLSDHELSILLTDDEEMRSLNRSYRDLDRSTDVLSFSQLEGGLPGSRVDVLGDVVISLPTAARQARDRGVGFWEELLELLVHGVLHLAGYEHVGAGRRRAAEMKRVQARLVELLHGFGGR